MFRDSGASDVFVHGISSIGRRRNSRHSELLKPPLLHSGVGLRALSLSPWPLCGRNPSHDSESADALDVITLHYPPTHTSTYEILHATISVVLQIGMPRSVGLRQRYFILLLTP